MRNYHFPGRSPVMSTKAMIATSQPMATQAGLDILRAGGNALDAAIAASAVLSVVESYSTGLGGDCFMLYHEAATGELHALNGSGRSPAAANVEAIRSRGYDTIPERGILSVTVPGAVDAWYASHDLLGQLAFDELLQPAIDYAEDGYVVSPMIAHHWALHEPLLAKTPEAANAYLLNGKAPTSGVVHRQPDLARSLRLIAQQGRDVFYQGEIAAEIVRYSQTLGGLLTVDDLAAHSAEWVDPICSNYRGHRVYQVPPNGQGITVLMALNIMAQTDVAQYQHLSADHIHLLSQAFSLAMAERDRFVADAAFHQLPIETLLSTDFAREQFARISSQKALDQPIVSLFPNHQDTVYLTVVDENRNVCSMINSIFYSWGSGLVAGNTGINLQNRGSGFSMVDGHFNQLLPNKRPMHTIIPAMVYKDLQPVLGFGVMGGQYQAMGQSYVLSNRIDYLMDVQAALDTPRFFLYDGRLEVEQGVADAVRQQLIQKGYRLNEANLPHGGGQAIAIDWQQGVLQGGSDPRKDGSAAGF